MSINVGHLLVSVILVVMGLVLAREMWVEHLARERMDEVTRFYKHELQRGGLEQAYMHLRLGFPLYDEEPEKAYAQTWDLRKWTYHDFFPNPLINEGATRDRSRQTSATARLQG